ncbi:MAG: hypothetical protein EOO89_28230 [Pedobacter sp.]|nr:MAG: hypothetical protein EOO89_28230 [Pedobacter sp.]
MTFGFNQRIKRAGINKLNPFVDRSNPNFETSGNPNLRPSRMNQISVGYNGFKKFSANISVDYQFANGLFIPIATFNAATQVTRTTFENVGNANGITLNMNFSYPITKAWNVSGNGNTELISLLAPKNGVVSRTTVVMYRLFGTSMYKFEKDWKVYGNINYVSQSVTTLQGRASAYVGTSFGFIKDMAKNKLTFSGSVNNPFTKYRENFVETTSPEFYQTNYSQEYFRAFNLSLNYRFGKLKESIKKNKRGIRNDDMSN